MYIRYINKEYTFSDDIFSYVFKYSFSLFPYEVPLSTRQQILLPVFRSPEICVEMYITGSPAVIQCRSGPQAGCGMCCLVLIAEEAAGTYSRTLSTSFYLGDIY